MKTVKVKQRIRQEKRIHKQSNIGSVTAVRMIRCLAKTPQLLGPSVTFDLLIKYKQEGSLPEISQN